MQTKPDDIDAWPLQQKAQYVLQKMVEGDLRAQWFFDKLTQRLGIDHGEAHWKTSLLAAGQRW